MTTGVGSQKNSINYKFFEQKPQRSSKKEISCNDESLRKMMNEV